MYCAFRTVVIQKWLWRMLAWRMLEIEEHDRVSKNDQVINSQKEWRMNSPRIPIFSAIMIHRKFLLPRSFSNYRRNQETFYLVSSTLVFLFIDFHSYRLSSLNSPLKSRFVPPLLFAKKVESGARHHWDSRASDGMGRISSSTSSLFLIFFIIVIGIMFIIIQFIIVHNCI